MLTPEEKDYLKRVAPLSGRGLPVLLGSQPARVVGSGGDFFQLRHYVPGDDLRKVAWRLSTRTGRFLLREPKHEGPMVWRRWVDPTPSMRLAPRQAKVANLIEAMDWVWSRHRDRFHDLTNWTWGNTPLVIVSDFIWEERQWADFAQLRRRQQIRLVHVALREEIQWTNPPEYVEDCETGARLRIDSDPEAIQAAQRQYWAKVQQAVKGLPLARATVGESDLTALEGVIWS